MRNAITIVALIAVTALFTGCATQQTHFGESMFAWPESTTELCAHPDKYEGKYVKVSGYVKDLCTHSGCWMELADKPDAEGDGVLVVFTYDREEHGRVPAEAKGHKATVEGKVVLASITEQQRRADAKQHGATPDEIAAIRGDKQIVKLECPAASVDGVKSAENEPCTHEHEDDEA
jgi:hypothetical protein